MCMYTSKMYEKQDMTPQWIKKDSKLKEGKRNDTPNPTLGEYDNYK